MKVTIIRTSSFGDIVLTEPIFKALKQLGYDTELITQKKFLPVVQNNPHIDNIFTTETISNHQTDILIDLQRNFISANIRKMIQYNKLIKVNKYYKERFLYVNFHLNTNFPDVITRYKNAVEKGIGKKLELSNLEFFPSKIEPISIPQPFIVLALHSKWYTKSYPYDEELIDLFLKNTTYNIVLVGKNNCQIQNKRVCNLNEDYPIDQAAAIIKNANCMIAVDSLWMHIGIGLSLKTFAIFGSTTPKLGFVSPYNNPFKIIETNLKCRPCTKIGRKKCPKNHFKCMKLLTPHHIWEEVKNECNR